MKNKKSILVMIALMLITAFTFFACGKAETPKASFTQSEFVFSLKYDKHEIDFDKVFGEHIKLEGVKASDITFELNDYSFISLDNGKYVFTQPGRTLVFAKKGNNVLATAPVIVTPQFDKININDITLDDDGVLHWPEVSTFENGGLVLAQDYILKINGQELGRTIRTNEFDLAAYDTEPGQGYGNYIVEIKADAADYVDDGDFSDPVEFHINRLNELEITDFTTLTNWGGQDVIVYWQGDSYANYNIYVNGMKYNSVPFKQNQYTLPLYSVEGGKSVNVTIEAFATGYISRRKTITIEKLETPKLNYSVEDGAIVWNGDSSLGYTLNYKKLQSDIDESTKAENIFLTDHSSLLEGLAGGVYEVAIQALGGKAMDEGRNVKYYANSDTSEKMTFVKLEIDKPTYFITGETLTINLSPDEYIENYILLNGDEILEEWNTKTQGLNFVVDLSGLTDPRDYSLKLIARPSFDGDSVRPYDDCHNVLNSDAQELIVYVLEGLDKEKIKHELEDCNSVITFDEIEYATHYKVTINGAREIIFIAAESTLNGEVTLRLDDISDLSPQNNKYIITIEAYRDDKASVNVIGIKELTILANAKQASHQENGYYIWGAVDGAIYEYEIFAVDKDFDVGNENLTDAIQMGGGEIINGGAQIRINEKIEDFGYYFIRVFVRSGDKNNSNLDADFHDKQNVLEKKFVVYEQIETPTVTFDIKSKSITITTVDYADKYIIKFNDATVTYDAKFAVDGKLNHAFDAELFDKAGDYEIAVYATAGITYDKALHTQSEERKIQITRLALPTLTSGNIAQTESEQKYIVSKPDYCESVVVFIDGKKATIEDGKVDLTKYSEFTLKVEYKAIASDSENGHYYLDNEASFEVKRIATPEELEYENGFVKYKSADDDVDRSIVDWYNLYVTVNWTNKPLTVQAPSYKSKQFDLQSFIDGKLDVEGDDYDEEFALAYSQMTSLDVAVVAYKCGYVGNAFYLPSYYARTIADESYIRLTKLDAPVVAYNTETRTLSWSKVGVTSETKYAIYVDGALKEGGLTGNTYSRWEGVDFSLAKQIYIVASNVSYLNSSESNLITVKKLDKAEVINVWQNQDGKYMASLTALEYTHIAGAVVNDTEPILELETGYLALELSKYTTSGTFTIYFKANKNLEDYGIYFENSDVATFYISDIASSTIEVEIGNGKIGWNRVASEKFADNITYTIILTPADTQQQDDSYQKKVLTKETEYSLDEDDFTSLTTGRYYVQVVAQVDEYSLDATQIGYYGICQSDNLTEIGKLEKVGSVSVTVRDAESELTSTRNKTAFTAILSWEDIWEEEVDFEVSVNGGTTSLYRVTPSDNRYSIEIDQSLFKAGENTVSILVKSKTAIVSNEYQFVINRYAQVTNLQMSENGVLTFSDGCKNYLVALIMISDDGEEYVYEEATTNSVDLMQKFKQWTGRYRIEVVGYDVSNANLPSSAVATMSGTRLAGIEDVGINNLGEVEITLHNEVAVTEGIAFTAKYGTQTFEFSPRQNDGTTTFVYRMIDFVNDLVEYADFDLSKESAVELKLNVRKIGSVSSLEYPLTFDYKIEDSDSGFARGMNYADDYLIITNLDGTSAITLRIAIYNGEELSRIETRIFDASKLAGYWITVNGQQYFTDVIPDGLPDGHQAKECFGVSLNALLASEDYAHFEISFSRVVKYGSAEQDGAKNISMAQYSEKTIAINRLPTITSLSLQNGELTWATPTQATGVYVYFQAGTTTSRSYFKYVTTGKIDLKKEELTPGDTYNISIVSVSSIMMQDDRYLLASREFRQEGILKYGTPSNLTIENGKIVFDRSTAENSDLFKAIRENYTTTTANEFLRMIYETRFTSPFNLITTNHEVSQIRLRFSNGNTTHTATVSAVQLLPFAQCEFEYGSRLTISYRDAFMTKFSDASDTLVYKDGLRQLYNALLTADGIADDEMLFDDFGSIIPDGLYNISAQQIGSDALFTITSEYSSATETAVTVAPRISLDDREIDSQTHYLIKFSPVQLKTSLTESEDATVYTLRMTSGVFNYYFTVNYVDGKYQVSKVVRKSISQTSEYPMDFELTVEGEYIVIDVTNLFKRLKTNNSTDDIFMRVASYQFTVYAQGNGYAISSKNEFITLNLLGINASDIRLDKGVLYWTVDPKFAAFNTAIRYSLFNEESSLPEIEFIGNRASLVLPEAGVLYDYIVLSITGGRGKGVLNIDSDRYMIENIYVQAKPNIIVEGNHFVLPYSSSVYATNKFEITNNANNDIESVDTTVGGANEYWGKAEGASEYYFSLIGNSVSFTSQQISGSEDDYQDKADYRLVYTEANTCVLSAEIAKKAAKMLKAVEAEQLRVNSAGDLEWNDIQSDGKVQWAEGENRLEAFELGVNQILVYEVTINRLANASTHKLATYYTKLTTFDTLNLSDLQIEEDDILSFDVRTFVYVKGSENDHAIVTLEGDYLKLNPISVDVEISGSANAYFYILASQSVALSDITQAAAPTAVKTSDGQLVWTVANASLSSGVIDGKGNYYNVENSGLTDYAFIPSLSYKENPHRLRVFTFDKSQNTKIIKSRAVAAMQGSSDLVYKLPNIESGDYTLSQDDIKITLNFDYLFTNKTILSTSSFYKIQVTITFEDGGERTLVSTAKGEEIVLYTKLDSDYESIDTANEYYIGDRKIKKLSFQTVDNQDTQAIMTLNSEITTNADLNYDAENVEVKWNSDKYQFEFYGIDDQDVLYNISLTYQDGNRVQDEVSTPYYQPTRLGTITEVSVKVRKANALYSDSFTFTPGDRESWEYNLFNSGLGTSASPYQIASGAQFANMQYRNTREWHFELASDIQLIGDGFVIADEFNANLNGNSRSINVSITPHVLENPISKDFVISSSHVQNIIFESGGAIFGKLGRNSVVTNVNISASLNFVTAAGGERFSNSLLAGLALENYGTINNVVITSLSTSAQRGITTAAQAGLVGLNYGTVSDCENAAQVRVTAYSANAIVAGLVLSNENNQGRSRLTRCFNTGAINVDLMEAGGNRAWVSGVATINDATITQSGNDGNIQVGGTGNSSRIIAGVCIVSSNTMSYCYNNGKLSSTSASDPIGGLAFFLNGGTVGGLVNTSGLKIAVTAINARSSGNNYCAAETDGLTTQSLPDEGRIIDCGDKQHSLIIDAKANGGKARIQ